MTEEAIEVVNRLMRAPNSRVELMRAAKEVEPVNGWARSEAGKTLYVVIAVGPEDAEVENSIRAALGHDVMSFKK